MQSKAQALYVFKEVLFHPGMPSAYENLAAWATEHGHKELARRAMEASVDVDETEAEFNRMCIGPYRLTVPPYESVWRSQGRVLNNLYSAAVLYAYEKAGLEVNREFNELPDFIGNELEFVSALFLIASESHAQGDFGAAHTLSEMAETFWAEHLGHWVADFLEAIEEDTKSEFWAAWAQTLEKVLDDMFKSIPLSYDMDGVKSSNFVPMTFVKKESL